MKPLAGLKVVSIAVNLPGPACCARLRDWGAGVVKVEPPTGDPLQRFSPGWYERLCAGMEVRRLDLKSDAGARELDSLLADADLLVSAQRPSAMARLGLDAERLAKRHPRLCSLAIHGHRAPHEEDAGHDLTYLAQHGLVSPPALPATLFADMAGSERAVSTALALLHARTRDGRGRAASVALADVAAFLAQPRDEGLTAPGAILGGGLAAYNLYQARDGWIAVAALEPHFARRLAQALGLEELTRAALAECFGANTVAHWERWAAQRDLPLAAVHPMSPEERHADS